MIKKLLFAGCAAALSLGTHSLAEAAVIVTLEDAVPTENVFASYVGPGAATIGWLNKPAPSTNRSNVGFAFHNTEATTLTGFGIFASLGESIGEDDGWVTILIREHATLPTGNLSNSAPADSVYKTYSAQIQIDSFSGSVAEPGIINFDLGAEGALELKADYYYTIQLKWTTPAAGQRFTVIHGDDPNNVSVGSWDGDGSTWTARNTRDYLFYAYGQPIPEPSTYVLMGLAAAGAALYRRRK